MAKVKAENSHKPKTGKLRPALTPDGAEKRLFGLALNAAEQHLIDGTASSQEITTILRLFSRKDSLEREKLEEENKLLRAKTEALQSQKESNVDYKKVLRAFSIYSGKDPDEVEENYDEYDY